MSEAASSARQADHERELDEIATELYGLRPDTFAGARDDQVRKARAEGRQPLARDLSRLRRPSQSAWLINLLWRDQRDVLEQLLRLADELSRAQAQASGPELLRLTARRRELEAALIRGARALAEKAGVNVSVSMERDVQETLSAALALPDVANEVRTGRLVKPASYAGFGTFLPSAPSEPSAPSAPPAAARHAAADDDEHSLPATSRPPKLDDGKARADNRARERREEAERRLQDARVGSDVAAGALAEQRRAAEAAHQHHQVARKQVDELQEQLRDLQVQLREAQEEVAAAEQAAIAAAGRRDQAEKTNATALRALELAEQSLKVLPQT